MASLREDFLSLKTSNENIKHEAEAGKLKMVELEQIMDAIENENKQRNIIVNGLRVKQKDTRREREDKVQMYSKDQLGLENINIEKTTVLKNARNSLLVKLNSLKDKNDIFDDDSMKLRETCDVHVSNDSNRIP
ncbi:hypothetical protein SNE40_022965 [Patella caerulea]|uniref:Uncharacterized protein n=1 Tax=Patella caerulea TaxID=87958 RepID=A0AAN8IVK3_PATCE